MFTLACHPDYRGRGIATELVRQALKVFYIIVLIVVVVVLIVVVVDGGVVVVVADDVFVNGLGVGVDLVSVVFVVASQKA
jgi:hypothetical protein